MDGSYDTACSKDYTQEYLDSVVELLRPAYDELKKMNLFETTEAYVYGFDE